MDLLSLGLLDSSKWCELTVQLVANLGHLKRILCIRILPNSYLIMACFKTVQELPQVSKRLRSESHPSGCLMDSGGGKNTKINSNFKTNSINHQRSRGMKIATWNIKTLLDSTNKDTTTLPRRTAVLAKEFQKYNIDIIALQETHLQGFGKLEERSCGYTYYYSGSNETSNEHGVAIGVRTSLIKTGIISEPTCINERLMSLEIIEKNCKTVFICCYAPTNVHDETVKTDFYENLEKIIKNVPKNYGLILAGDFNARIGKDHEQWRNVIGKHGFETTTNNNGEILLEFCALEGLSITNTWFQQKNKYKGTWQHPRSKRWHMIDHIIVRHSRITEVKKCRVMRGAQVETDHHMMRATVLLKPKRYIQKKDAEPIYDSKCLKQDDIRNKFNEGLEIKTINLQDNTNVEGTWKNVKDIFTKTAAETMEKKKRKRPDWFDECDEEVSELLNMKQKSYHRYLANPAKINKTKYQETRRSCQQRIRKVRDDWWSKKSEELQAFIDCGDSYHLYQGIKNIVGPVKTPLNVLINEKGDRIEGLDDRLKTWSKYFETLLNQETETDRDSINLSYDLETIPSDEPPNKTEIKNALQFLKNNKSPGNDQISAEMLKAGQDVTVSLLHKLFNKIWCEKQVPQDWKESIIIPIHKKGNKFQCENYRGISLLSVPGKVLSRVLYNRLYPFINSFIKDTQCGFRSGRSTTDMIFTVRQLVEKACEQNTSLCIGFIDIAKAFDSVDREILFKLLDNIKCPPTILAILRSLHSNTLSTVRIENSTSVPFEIKTGVKQGCVLAPLLFILYMHAIIESVVKKKRGGVEIRFRSDFNLFNRRALHAKTKTTEKHILDLMFADDSALVAKTPEALQEVLNIFNEEARKFGLRVNEGKTEVMFVNCSPAVITMNGKTIKEVNSFKYLGSNIQNDCQIKNEINHRINSASQSFQKLYLRVWKRHEINLKTKLLVYQTIILSTLLYSSETWTLLEESKRRLNAFHQRCLRTICKISWMEKIPNEEVLRRTKMLTVENLIKIRRLRWAGHISRMNEERTPHQIVFSELKCGKRPQQKPKKRWLDMLKQDMREQNINEKEWRKVAANRNEWRRHIQQKTVERQEMQNLEAEERRKKRHEEEEMYSWKCPICGFTREGRSGRQYVNSHLSQAHRSQVDKLRQRQENSSPRCTVCNINFKKKSGHSSHMRHKHPTLTAENTLKPIKLRKPQSSSHSASPTQISQPQLSGQSSSGYPFNCASCGRNFKTKAGLSNHRRGALCKNRMEEEVSSATMET